MATNVCIIEIDLGDIDRIISEGVTELQGESKDKLEIAVQQRIKLEKIRLERETAKKEAADKVDQSMLNTYNQLLQAGQRGILQERLLQSVQPHIKSTSALTTKLKRYLREDGNKYALGKKKLDNDVYYYFEPFNL